MIRVFLILGLVLCGVIAVVTYRGSERIRNGGAFVSAAAGAVILFELIREATSVATVFVLAMIILGWLMGYGLRKYDLAQGREFGSGSDEN